MKTSSSRRLLRHLLIGSLVGLLLIVFLFIGSNLYLTSGAGQRFLAKNLERRSPALSWQVTGARWSPWNGLTIKRLSASAQGVDEAHQARLRPLFTLENTEIQPYWGQLIRGKKLFREVLLEEPEFNIPLEYILVAAPSQPPLHSPPAVPAKAPPTPPKDTSPALPPTQSKPPSQASTPQKKEQTQKTPSPSKAPTKNKKSEKPPTQSPPPPEPPDELRFWLRLRSATVNFYSVTKDLTLTAHGIDADLPLAGPTTEGHLGWEKATLNGKTLLSSQSLAVEWKNSQWNLTSSDLELILPQLTNIQKAPPRLKLIVSGSFSPRKGQRNFRLQASLPSQPLPDYVVHQQTLSHLSARSAALTFDARGQLLNPNTWRLNSALAMNQLEVFSELRGQHFHFDTARAALNFKDVRLQLPNLSLRSERFSLMGNGGLGLNGYLLGVLRIVVDPELNERITSIAIGSRISQGWTNSWLRPLETPDRFYRDLHFEGILPDTMVNTGRRNTELPLNIVLELLKNFVANEVAEDLITNP